MEKRIYENFDDFSYDSAVGIFAPQKTYSQLIVEAIFSSPESKLTLSQIYDWMRKNVPAFAETPPELSGSWKNCVRHNLSLHKFFKRIPINGKNSFWTVDYDQFRQKIQERQLGRRRARTMPHLGVEYQVAQKFRCRSGSFLKSGVQPNYDRPKYDHQNSDPPSYDQPRSDPPSYDRSDSFFDDFTSNSSIQFLLETDRVPNIEKNSGFDPMEFSCNSLPFEKLGIAANEK